MDYLQRIFYSKKLINFAILLISIIIFVAVFSLLKNNTVGVNEIEFFAKNLYKSPDAFQTLLLPADGKHISNLVLYAMDYFSDTFKIHPNTIMATFGAGFRAVLSIILCYLLASSAFMYSKKSLLFPLFMLISFICVLYRIFDCSFMTITAYSYFYGYLTGLIIYFLFWHIVIKHVTDGKVPQTKYIPLYCIIAFLLGISNEPANAASIVTILLLLRLCFLIFAQKSKWKPMLIIEKFKNLGLSVYLPILALLGGMVLYCLNPSFQDSAMEKFSLSSWAAVVDFLKYFPSFLIAYLKVVFVKNGINFLLILFLALSVLFYGIDKRRDRRFVFITIMMIVGMCAFLFALIFFGKTFPFNPDGFWLYNSDYLAVFNICLFTTVLSLLGYLLSIMDSLPENNQKKITIWVTIVILLIGYKALSVTDDVAEQYIRKVYQLEEQRKNLYMGDKMYLYYAHKNLPIVLPIDLSNSHSLLFFILTTHDKNLHQTKQLTPEDIEKSSIFDTKYWDIYMSSIYHVKGKGIIKFLPEEEALAHYKKSGGIMDNKEIEEADFQKLFDKDFVLKSSKEQNIKK